MIAYALILFAILGSPQDSPDPQESAFRAQAERYWRIVERRPRPGTGFDLLYRHYFDADRLDQLDADLERRSQDESDKAAWPILTALVHQRRSRWDAAHVALAEAARRAPADPYPHYARGLLFDRQVQLEDAVAELRLAVQLGANREETLDALKRIGRNRLRQGELALALEAFNELADKFPGDRQVLEELAELLAGEGERDEAIRRWEQVVALSDDPYQRLKAEIQIAELRVGQGRHRTAIDHFGRLLDTVAPGSWFAEDLHRRIEDSFLGSADPRGLVRFYKARVADHPDDIQSLVNLSRAHAALGDDEPALASLRSAIEKAPTRSDLRETLIESLVSAGQYAEAVIEGEFLVEQSPQDVQSMIHLGRLYLLGATAETRAAAEQRAIDTWKRVTQIRPDDPTLAVQVAEACRTERQALRARTIAMDVFDEPRLDSILNAPPSPLDVAAEQFFREGVRRAPDVPQYHEFLGDFLHHAGRRDEAIEAWAGMVAHDTVTAADWSRLADVYASFGYFEPAIDAAESAVKLGPQSFPIRDQLVDLLTRHAQFDRAERELKLLESLVDEPVFRERLVGRRVELYVSAERDQQWIVKLRRKVDAAPGTLEEYWTLARLLASGWNHVEAARWMAQAVELAGDDVLLLREYARILHRAEMIDESIEQYRRLVQVDEKNRSNHYEQIVELELQRGNHEEAKRVADMLITRSPANLNGYRLRAAVAFRLNERASGLATLRRAIDVAPRDFTIRRELASALSESSRPNEALEHLWRCFELTDQLAEKRSLISVMTDLAQQARRYDDFLAELRALGQRQETRKMVGLCLVDSLLRSRRLEQAQAELNRLLEDEHDDLEVLEQLSRLAATGRRWSTAIGYQKRIVAISPTRDRLETLARYYLENNNDRLSQEVWRRIVDTAGDASSIVIAADQAMTDGRFAHGLMVIELGLSRFPDSWQLHYRRGFVCYVMRHWAAAAESFDRLAADYPEKTSSPPVKPRRVPTGPQPSIQWNALSRVAVPEVVELMAARDAFARYESPISIDAEGKLHLPNRRAVVRNRSRGSAPLARYLAMPATRRAAVAESVVARYWVSQRMGDHDAWLEARRQESVDELRVLEQLLLIHATSGQLHSGEGRAVLIDALQRLGDHPLPRFAALVLPGVVDPSDPAAARQDAELREILVSCYEWVHQRRPQAALDIQSAYIDQLWRLGGHQRAAAVLTDKIAAAGSLQDLGEVGTFAFEWDDMPLVEKVLIKASSIASAQVSDAIEFDALMGLLTLAVTVEPKRLPGDNEQRLIDLFRVQLATDPPAGSTSAALNVGALQVLQSQIVQLRGQINLVQQTGAGQSVIVDRLVRRQQWLLDQYRLNQKRTGQRNPFPRQGQILNGSLFSLLQIFQWRMNQSPHASLLQDRLIAWTDEESGAAADRCRMALVCVLFWNDELDRAVAVLDPWSQAAPENAEVKMVLVDGLLRIGRMKQALAVLDSIKDPGSQLAAEIKSLRADVSRRWSDTFNEKVLAAHEHVIRTLAVSPDASLLASGSYDRTVILWNLPAGTVRHRLAGHSDTILSIAFSPDGQTLASCGYDGSIRLWNVETGKLRRVLHEGPHVIRAVAFTRDGNRLVTGGDDKLVTVWDLDTGKPRHSMAGHTEMVFSVDVSSDGKSVATGSADHSIRIWDLETATTTSRLDGHSGTVTSVRFSPDGQLLASASDDDTIKLWKLADSEFFATLIGHTSTVTGVAFSPDGKLLASSGKDKTVKVWSVFRRRSPFTMNGHTNAAAAVTFTQDGKYVASAGYDRLIILWRLRISEIWGEHWDE